MVLGESAKGVPPKVEEWFYPGDSTGNEFIYGKTSGKSVAYIGLHRPPFRFA